MPQGKEMLQGVWWRGSEWEGVFVGKSSKGQVEEVLGFTVYSSVGRGRHEGSGSVPAQLPGFKGPVVRPPHYRPRVSIFVKTAMVFPYCCMDLL